MMHSLNTHTHLKSYVEAVMAVVDQTIRQAGLHPEQERLLLARSGTHRPEATKVLAHPLAPFYLAVRAHGALVGRDAEALGAGFLLFNRALTLTDAVQDDELAGPYEEHGSEVAINCGLTLFFLALDTLWAAERAGPLAAWDLRSSLRINALRLSRGQHRDLSGRGYLRTPAEVLDIAVEKSAICTLLMEFAAIYAASVAPERFHVDLALYRTIGDALAQIQQITDDLTDLFGPSDSQDLRTGTWNVPLTILLHTMPEAARAQRAASLRTAHKDEVCRLLYDTQALHQVAAVTEAARIRIHQTFSQLPCGGPYLAMLLAWLDDLVAILYPPRVLNPSRDISMADSATLHPADAALFEQLRAARCAVQEAQKRHDHRQQASLGRSA